MCVRVNPCVSWQECSAIWSDDWNGWTAPVVCVCCCRSWVGTYRLCCPRKTSSRRTAASSRAFNFVQRVKKCFHPKGGSLEPGGVNHASPEKNTRHRRRRLHRFSFVRKAAWTGARSPLRRQFLHKRPGQYRTAAE